MAARNDFDAFEEAAWSAGRAAPYERGVGSVTRHVVDPLLDAAGVGPGTRLLDVATGPGLVAERAARRGASVVAVDFSQEMLALAADRLAGTGSQVTFLAGDSNALPFDDGAFDAVVAGFLMPHVADLPRAVAECARTTRDGGRCAFSTWDSVAGSRFVGAVLQALNELGVQPPPDLPAGPPFFQYSADEEFASLLIGAGLVDPVVETVRFTHHIDDLDQFWADLLAGTVRTTVLVTSQPARMQQQILSRYGELLAPYRDAGGYDVPCSVKVGSARRAVS